MALENCRDCNNQVSKKAYDCPHCGANLRKPKRGFFGVLAKWTFILFNCLMIYILIKYIGAGAEAVSTSASDAENAGSAIGMGLSLMFIAAIWVTGDIILGMLAYFTRAHK